VSEQKRVSGLALGSLRWKALKNGLRLGKIKMGYRNNNRGNMHRSRPPKGPVKLAFGIVKDKATIEAEKLAALMAPKAQEPVFTRQELVGTLHLKSVDLTKVRALPPDYLERVQTNLAKVYEEGKHSNSRCVIDFQDGELLVAFPFDQSVVERIKGLDRNERAWDPDARCWRVYPALFDDLLDFLGRGTKVSETAYAEICRIVQSPYYAVIARSKLGKLVVREAWYEEIRLPAVDLAFGSNAYLALNPTVLPEGITPDSLESMRTLIHNFSFKRKPYEHQLKGIEYLLMNKDAALLDEMGCGKSFQIASTLGILFRNKDLDKALIIAPMSLIRTWQDELRMATDEPFVVIGGTPSQRLKALKSDARIFIVHYEGLRLEEEKLEEWLKQGRGMMIFDESQRIKNLLAQTTRAALKLRPVVERCVIATGTPIANRPLDLFAQYFVMDRGRTFGSKFSAFKEAFCELEIIKVQVGRKLVPKEKFLGVRNGDELRSRIMKTSLRRLKTDVLDLPPILYKDYVVELKAEQRVMYQQMRDTLRIQVSQMSDSQVISEASSLAVQLLRLSQIASNPRLLDPKYEASNAKVSELEDLLEDILEDDTKKVILWSHFVENVNWLTNRFKEKYITVAHTGEMSVDDRQQSVFSFQNDPETRLFIATPQSAKEGLTLVPKDGYTRADTMIYLDLSFDSGSYLQSQARFHRIGQEAERCLVIHLIGENTIDEYIRRTVIDKIQTSAKLLDGEGGAELNKILQPAKFSKAELMKVL
jgi:SWI/SNF-related matrix-associated actin-dependent regulator 1 of chromatin subfamily A